MRKVFELMESKSVGLTGRSVIRTTTRPGSAFGTGFVTNANPAKGSFASKFCCSTALLLIFFSLGEPRNFKIQYCTITQAFNHPMQRPLIASAQLAPQENRALKTTEATEQMPL
jgi:hypothetical protein